MQSVKSRVLGWFLVVFALTGFAVAEPVFALLRQTSEFLIARQNSVPDVVVLAASLSFVLPLIAVMPAWITAERFPGFSRAYVWFLATGLCACLFAQIIQPFENVPTAVFLLASIGLAIPASYLLLFSRWRLLAYVLTVIAVVFPLRFLLFSPVLDAVRGLPESSFSLEEMQQAPDIVFVVFDELPLATILDRHMQVDGRFFPGFKRLQNISDWYFDASSIADSTMFSVPAMLTGRYPEQTAGKPTIAEQPVNLFTLLRNRYSYNVIEPVTRLCPSDQCSLIGPGSLSRIRALLLDLSAVYLHRITPASWKGMLPDVESNWSGFFADRQIFFPQGWLNHMGELVEVDRLGLFRRFISSLEPAEDRPGLNFIHVLLPHEPLAYLPNGENYGLVWMRGREGERWEDHDWGIASAKQRHFLQTQLADRLLDELLDQMESKDMLDSSLLVVVADHGASFLPGDQKRVLSDMNAASMLRIPLFIKSPGQVKGRRITFPTMTIDILPTVLSQLGVDVSEFDLNGIDLGAKSLPESRDRFGHSYASGQTQMRLIAENRLDVAVPAAVNREQLKLDDEKRFLWGIGPLDQFRGRSLESVCAPQKASVRFRFSNAKPMPQAKPDQFVPAFVAGTVSGPQIPQESRPFVVSSNEVVVASGMTWYFRDNWRFFALIEPSWVKHEDWAPEIALVADGRCLQESDT